VLPVPEAHTVETLPGRKMLLSGNRCYDDKYSVVICGETKQCKMWLPRREDGTRDKLDLEFKDRVLQVASAPRAVVPGIVAQGEWSGPTEVGVSRRRQGEAEPLRLDSLRSRNIFMALEGEKKKKAASKATASVPATPAAVPPVKLDPGRFLRLGGQPVVRSAVAASVPVCYTVSAPTVAVSAAVAPAPVSVPVLPSNADLIPTAPVVDPANTDVVGQPAHADVAPVLATCPLCGVRGDPRVVQIYANACLEKQERGDRAQWHGADGGAFDVSMSDPVSDSDGELLVL
jgi:hypothetical protein